MNNGWISLHRKMQEHWLWQENRQFSKAEAWIDILLSVNHKESKLLIKNKLILVGVGESAKSLDTWAKRWKWNKSKVRRFLEVLKNENMIEIFNEKKTTRLKVCKYRDFQDIRNDNETQTKRKRNDNETQTTPNNNDNNINNENNKYSFLKSIIDLGVDKDIAKDWVNHRKRSKSSNTKRAFDLLKKEFDKTSFTPNECIEICLGYKLRSGKVWSGFKSEWVKNLENKKDQPKKTDFETLGSGGFINF